ncbi:MAG: hypothetical protein QNJ71_01565 [Acidimicrobiia bacterium]|nr:hypothetical protein [Acidimicrobiia bacterium]
MGQDKGADVPSERDPFDVLGGFDPVDEHELPDPHSEEADALLDRIVAEPRSPERRTSTPRWRRTAVVAFAAVVVIAAVAMTWRITLQLSTPVVACYEAADLDSDRFGFAAEGFPTVESCRAPWLDGTLQSADVAAGQVPPLTGCVTESGDLAVFPSAEAGVCEALGLADLVPSQRQDGLSDIALANERLIALFIGSECIAFAEAEVAVRAILDESGLAQWSITGDANQQRLPCMSYALDVSNQTVILVGIPGPEEE